MMGHQVNFYLTNRDQAEFLQSIEKSLPVVGIWSDHEDGPPDRLPLAPLAIWRPGDKEPYLINPEWEGEIVYVQFATKLGRRRYIDIFSSPVVEFSRCITNDRGILRGRLFYVSRYVTPQGTKIEKPQEFLGWAKAVFRVLKGKRRLNDRGNYVGEEAAKLFASGMAKPLDK